ncbi:uncharacterized protein MYCGRDRAFT_102753 [Zymoseptoria tritici IPO323]|uniref:Uncharacterized protein n=1 Tax=Zymoseptoria tritici (strain CBS 115943 / IPO323) TaxID=336722 RepID=F9X0E7_ZYMTI|nr:uncharacterized protein MYCGRDRAFT_102753 [Zymoseptoria tritici IPO323]EGP91530.1 hypothetical protein MYCGRDRAFT_102753 [Zymoseptoria tritici IPO323]
MPVYLPCCQKLSSSDRPVVIFNQSNLYDAADLAKEIQEPPWVLLTRLGVEELATRVQRVNASDWKPWCVVVGTQGHG